MRFTHCLLLIGVVLICLAGVTLSQEPEESPAQVRKSQALENELIIKAGESVADVRRALAAQKMERDGVFALRMDDPDEAHFGILLDREHTWACVFYSKSKQTVTRISMIFTPSRTSGKAAHSWIQAGSVIIHEDGSYTVHFAAPVKP